MSVPLLDQYQSYLDKQATKNQPFQPTEDVQIAEAVKKLPRKLCIVGAGMAGLYSALMLKHYNIKVEVKIFEANERIGGRVHTHKFSTEPHQYFEAGAMRFPEVHAQKPLLDLIKYLNQHTSEENQINLISYKHSDPSGNLVCVNGMKQKDGEVMTVDYANKNLQELGFPSEADATEQASKLLNDAIQPVIDEFKEDFEEALMKYNSMSMHYYLSERLKWSAEKINYVEVMTSRLRVGLVEQAILSSVFTQGMPSWKTIDKGMCQLPEAVATLIGEEKISLGARVESLKEEGCKVKVGYVQHGKMHHESFDAVILAIPAHAVNMIPEKPLWPVELHNSLHSIHYLPLYKIGLRFKNRFWEKCPRPSKGGKSITDLPCRWVVYPSYGIGDEGNGVLLMYTWMTDSDHWLPKGQEDKITMALNYLQVLYPNENIADLYLGGKPGCETYLKEAFAIEWDTGIPYFDEGQFTHLYPIMLRQQQNIYFAGDHLSMNHAWIVGALDSARRTVGQITGQNLDYLRPSS